MSDTTDVIRGTLKLDTFQEGKVYSDVDALIKSLADIFSVEIPTSITNVIISSTEPGDDFKDGLWIRRNTAGTFSGIYLFQGGAWTKVFPEAIIIGETATVGVDTGLWVETDAAGNYEKLWAYQNDTWLQLHPDPSPPDYAAIFATYYRSTIWGGVGVNAGSDNYFVTTVPLIDALIVPTTISFIPDTDNVGPTTINVNSLGAKGVINSDGSALSGGELQASVIVEVTFDGFDWVVSLPADISGAYILDNTITTNKLVDSLITTSKLSDVSVIGSKIGIAAISETKISPAAVTTAKIADLAVTAAKLAVGAVDELQLADNAVTTNKIDALAVTEAKLAVGAATETKIGPLAVTTAKIADLNVTTGKIANLNVTAGKLATDSVETLKIKDLNVTTAKIADLNITEGKIGALAVTSGKIGNNAVITTKIADLNVTTAKLDNNAVTAAKIAAAVAGNGLTGGGGSALAANVDDSTITIVGDKLEVKDNGITATQLNTNSVSTAKIQTSAVTNPEAGFTWSLINPSVKYNINPLATVPEIRTVYHMTLGKLLIINFYVADTTIDYFSDSESIIRLQGVSIAGTALLYAGWVTFTDGTVRPCGYDYLTNEISMDYGANFPTGTIHSVQGTIIVTLS